MENGAPILADSLQAAITTFRANKNLADKAMAQIDDSALHKPLDENTNSIAVIVKHVAGNLRSRWTDFLTTDGEKPTRDRDDEFFDDYKCREDMLADWESGWACLFDALEGLKPVDFSKQVFIRGEAHSVALAIYRSLAHCGYHIGQIVMLARHNAQEDWEVLTIPRNASQSYNEGVWGTDSYRSRSER